MQWTVIADNCADLRALSVHHSDVIGITCDGMCRMIQSDSDTDWSKLEPLFTGGIVPPLVELVGHSPETWLLGRTDDGEVWVVGPRAAKLGGGGQSACRVELPSPCTQLACHSSHRVALLVDGRVYEIGADKSVCAPAKAATSAPLTTHVSELDGIGVVRVAAGKRNAAVLTSMTRGRPSQLHTWGSAELYESGAYDSPTYAGELQRAAAYATDSDGDEDERFECDPIPRPASQFDNAIADIAAGAVGELVVRRMVSDAVLRPGLGGDPGHDGTAWRGAPGGIELLPAKHVIFVLSCGRSL